MPATIGTNGAAVAVEGANLEPAANNSDIGAGVVADAGATSDIGIGMDIGIGGGRRTASRARCSFMQAISISRCCWAWASALVKRMLWVALALAWACAAVEVEVAGEEAGAEAETMRLEEGSGEREPRELSVETLRLWRAVAGCEMSAGALLEIGWFVSCRRINQVTSRPVSGLMLGDSQFLLRISRISCSERAICSKRSLRCWLVVEDLAARGVPIGASCFLYAFSSLVVRRWRAISSLLVCQTDRSRSGTRLARRGLKGWMADWS